MTTLYRSLFFIFLLFIGSISLFAQVNGDYRTRNSGDWNDTDVWQRYSSGSWSNVTTAPTSANGTVTISHNININVNASASAVVISANTVTVENGITFGITGNLTLNGGNLRAYSPVFSSVTGNVSVGATLLLSGASELYAQSSALSVCELKVSVNGNVTLNNTSQLDNKQAGLSSASVSLTFNGSSTQAYSKANTATVADVINFTVASGSTLDLTGSPLSGSSGSFTLNSTGKVIAGNSNPIQVTGSKTYNSSADYEFKGSSTWSLGSTARNVVINNTSGTVTMSAPLTVTNNINFQNGNLITTSSNLLTINDDATATGFSNSSFVVGPVRKRGNDNFTFPIGRAGSGLVPIRISGLSGSSDFTAEYKRQSPITILGSLVTVLGLHHISSCEYWDLDRVGSATANVTMYWNTYSNCNAAAYVNDLSSIVAVHFNGLSWNAFSRNGGTTGTISSGTVTWNNVSSFSPFALGSTSAVMNPLAVAFTDVRATEKNGAVQIQWTNNAETNIEKYIVERSLNGNDFTEVDQKLPVNNQNDKAEYTSFDMAPQAGTNYYRVKAIELTGAVSYTKVLKVTIGDSKSGFTLYPNPTTGNTITANFSNLPAASYTLKVINSVGQILYSKPIKISQQGSSLTETLNLPFNTPGVYRAVLVGGENYVSQTFMIK